MRILALALCLTLPQEKDEALVGRWKLDEKEGAQAADSTGGGHPGTHSGGPQFAAGAPPGLAGCLKFDGKDDRVSAGDASAFVMKSAFTVSAWVHPDGGDGEQVILNKEGEYEIGRSGSGALQVALANDNPGWSWIDTGYALPTGKWTHLAWAYSSAERKIRVYANGGEVHSSEAEGEVGDAYLDQNQLWIGGRSKEEGCEYFAGMIADVRLYRRALSAAEVAKLCVPK